MFGLASPALSLIPPGFPYVCYWFGSCKVISEMTAGAGISRELHISGDDRAIRHRALRISQRTRGNPRTPFIVNRLSACCNPVYQLRRERNEMSQYYKHELARWEGEGGSHGELMPPS